MDIEEQERIDAVNRYIMGDKLANICRDKNRSKTWLFKWVNRFKTGDEEWYTSRSRAPKNHGRDTNNSKIQGSFLSHKKSMLSIYEKDE